MLYLSTKIQTKTGDPGNYPPVMRRDARMDAKSVSPKRGDVKYRHFPGRSPWRPRNEII